jgi:predicted RNase H-like HicB family nuclease
MREITFIVKEDEQDGGYTAHAHWHDGNRDIYSEGNSRDELVKNIKDALSAAFDEHEPKPDLIHLHFVRDEVIAR